MAIFETVLKSDLKKPVQIKQLSGYLFSGDNQGNKISVEVMDNGSPATLTGGVTGYVIREDNATVTILNGTLSGNKASIVLPKEAYNVIGRVSIVVKVGTVTVGACTSYVYKTSTDTLVDPTGAIPSLQELLAKISACEQATADANKVANLTVSAEAATGSTPDAILSETGSPAHKHITFKLVKGEKGETGNTGATPQLSIGTVTTLPAGSDATASLTGTDAAPVLNLGIPKGPSGNESIDDTAGLGDTDLVWSADKLAKEKLAFDGRKANSDSLFVYKEASGDIATVTDAVAEAVKQMRIEIAPVQDLHGYDHPWPAGGGKNLLNPTGTSGTDASVTYTKGTDGKWTSSGTASGTSTILVGEFDVKSGVSYTLNGCPSGGGSAAYRIDVRTAPSSIYNDWIDTGSGMTFTPSEDVHLYVYIRAASGTNMSGKTFSPMIRLASVTDDTFAPYSNICPISGWTGAKVTRTGKNLLPVKFYTGFGYNDTVGQVRTLVADESVTKNGNVFSKTVSSWGGTGMVSEKLKPGTYKCNIAVSADTAENTRSSLYVFDENFKIIRRVSNLQTSGTWTDTITISEGEAYIAVNVSSGTAGTVTITSPQIEFGSTATEYVPYDGETYQITFPSSAGTVYSGTLTVNQDGSGTLVVDRASVDLGTLTWTASAGAFYSTDLSALMKIPASTSVVGSYICSSLEQIPAATTLNANQYAVAQNGRLWSKDGSSATAADFKTAMSGVQLVYELATPVTYTLTAPEIITLLSGLNNVWSDTGDILSMLYPTDSKHDSKYAGIIHESITDVPIASFVDGAEGVPVKKLEVQIDPVQDLHGYDNPWPAGGGKNLFHINASSYTVNNVAFTVGTDGTVSLSGTASADITFNVGTFDFKNGISYVLNGCPAGGSISTYLLSIAGVGYDAGSGYSYTPASDNTGTIRISVYSGTNVTGKVFKPMIRLSTVSDATFAPYSNICPISGWTGAKVSRTGINIWDEVWESGIITDSGDQDNANSIRSKNYNMCYPSTEYYKYQGTGFSGYPVIVWYDSNKNLISRNTSSYQLCTSPANARYFRISMYNYGTTYNHDISINYPSTYTQYHPGKVDTYPITFPTAAGTVYGGTLTVNKDGSWELVVNKSYIVADGVNVGCTGCYAGGATRLPAISISGNPAKNENEIIASYLRYNRDPDVSANKWTIMTFNNGSYIVLHLGDIMGVGSGQPYASDTELREAANTYLQSNNLAICYALATPTTYTLTPGQVKTLLGVNNLFADCGNITEVHYPADTKLYIDKKFAELSAAITALGT